MRQRSVQQQHSVAETVVRKQALHWRQVAWPSALIEAAAAHGVDCRSAIVVNLDIDFPGMPRLFGVLLTGAERFIEFEIDTDETHSKIELVEAWRDVTEDQDLNPQGRGTLAIKVLRELNQSA